MPPRATPMRVLVVDDDPLVRSLLEAVLDGDRFEIDAAADGTTGIAHAERSTPDAVILDVMMPGLDGYEVCRRLRQNASTRGARIVMLTAKTSQADRDQARAAGADAFLTKPFSPLELLDTLSGPKHVLAERAP